MNISAASVVRGCLLGLACGGGAFGVVLCAGDVPAKIHAWLLLAVAGIFAISESHFKSLLSELGALLRRGTYSVAQLEQLNQTVPGLRKRVSFAWAFSMWLKAGVGLACALLLWDGLPPKYRAPALFAGYALLFYSIALAVWARRNFRKLERAVDALTITEASVKEKRRLIKELESGEPHDFTKDKLAEGYTRPSSPCP